MKNILYIIILSFLFSFSVFAEDTKERAEQGDAAAQFNLALMYDSGQGVTQDYKKALKWYRLAAEQGYALAQNNLGVMHHYGLGVKTNYKEALRLYRLAAPQVVQSQYSLGAMYYQGQGVNQDIVIAYMWFYVAAKNGNPRSKGNVNVLAKEMKPKQITKAEKLAHECIKKNYKDCG